MAGSKIAAVGAVGAVIGGIGGAKAVSAAWKAASGQGSDVGGTSAAGQVGKGLGTAAGAVKTLGSAIGSRAKEKFTEAVRNTTGGRLAHKIMHENDKR